MSCLVCSSSFLRVLVICVCVCVSSNPRTLYLPHHENHQRKTTDKPFLSLFCPFSLPFSFSSILFLLLPPPLYTTQTLAFHLNSTASWTSVHQRQEIQVAGVSRPTDLTRSASWNKIAFLRTMPSCSRRGPALALQWHLHRQYQEEQEKPLIGQHSAIIQRAVTNIQQR